MSFVIPDPAGFPLAGAPLLASSCLRDGEAVINGLLEQRRFHYAGRQDHAQVRFSHVRLKSGHLFAAHHGVSLRVTSEPLRSFQVMVPLAGCLVREAGGREVIASPGTALTYSPGERMNTSWSPDCTAIVLSFGLESVVRFLHCTFPGFLADELSLGPLVDLKDGVGRSFANILQAMCVEWGNPAPTRGQGLITARLEEVLLLALLHTQEEIDRHVTGGEPRRRDLYVNRVVEFIEGHGEAELRMADLVDVANTSARNLQIGFVERFGIGPMTFVKRHKLRRVREALQQADPAASTVGDIAARWGFYNGSAFAKAYFAHFGELPSQTLRAVIR